MDNRNLSLLWTFRDELVVDCAERLHKDFYSLGVYSAVRYARMLIRTEGTHTHSAALRIVREREIEAYEEAEAEYEENRYETPTGSIWNEVAQQFGTAHI